MEYKNTPSAETKPLSKKLRVAFLASHNGTDMRAIIGAIHTNALNAEPVLLISNNSNASAIDYVQRESPIAFPTMHISNRSDNFEKSDAEVDLLISQALEEHKTDVVVLCGYMKKIGPRTLGTFEGKVLNVHPALLPDFKGHWGDKIYEMALNRRKKQPNDPKTAWTGVTIHLVNENYDSGEQVTQAGIKIKDTDSIGSLKERVQALEKTLYIQVLQDIANGNLTLGKEPSALRR